MATDPETVRREYPRTNPNHWKNITAEDIPPGWIDDMVKRLFELLNAQMIRAERASKQVSDTKDASGNFKDTHETREADARELARLQTALAKLTKMETERASLRAVTKTRKPSDVRKRLVQQLAETAQSLGAADVRGKDQ